MYDISQYVRKTNWVIDRKVSKVVQNIYRIFPIFEVQENYYFFMNSKI